MMRPSLPIRRRRPRGPGRGRLIASLAIATLAVASCSSPSSAAGDASPSGSQSTGSLPSGSSQASSDGCHADVTPYGDSDATKAPDVTAQTDDVSLPSGAPGEGKPTVRLGVKNFPESELLGQLYAQALKAKGYGVDFHDSIGASEIIDKKFHGGDIDLYPEYLGEIASSIAGDKPQDSAADAYQAAKKFEEAHRDATILQQTPYQNVDVLFVKPDFCHKHQLDTIGDLRSLGDDGVHIVFTAQKAAKDRYEGYRGLREAYDLPRARFYGVAVGGRTLDVVSNGTANVGDAFSTTPRFVNAVKDGTYVTLRDPKHIMGFQHVAPVVKQTVLDAEGDAFTKTLNWVSAHLTLATMHRLNKQMQTDGHSAEDVAAKYLKTLSDFPDA